MKKILLVLMITLPFFILKNVNASNLVSECVWESSLELDEFVENNLDFLNLKYDKKYKYIAYCIKKTYDSSKNEEVQAIAHGCLFNNDKDFKDSNVVNCSLYFTIDKMPNNHFRFGYSEGPSGFYFTPYSFSMTYKELSLQQESNALILSLLGIVMVIMFVFAILKMVGV